MILSLFLSSLNVSNYHIADFIMYYTLKFYNHHYEDYSFEQSKELELPFRFPTASSANDWLLAYAWLFKNVTYSIFEYSYDGCKDCSV